MVKNKRAAMEMSVGTIVTIVLLMAVLVLGLVLVRTIFTSSIENVKAIDENIKSQIQVLFAEDSSKKVVIYPADRGIKVKKGDSGGFAFSIRNIGFETGTFEYQVSAVEIAHTCQMSLAQADSLIILGRSGSFQIPSGDILEFPVHVNFEIPEEAPLCSINYGLDVKKDGETYLPTITITLEIK
jgi:hypothetical protein